MVYIKSFWAYLSQWVIILFFVRSCIHHVDDVINGDRGFSNVCGEDNLPPALLRALEHSLLVRY